MADTKHVPTPYYTRFVEGGYRRKERHEIRTVTKGGIGEPIALVRTNAPTVDADTAAFIVRAVNAHDDLVKALEEAKQTILNLAVAVGRSPSEKRALVNNINAALAKAKVTA